MSDDCDAELLERFDLTEEDIETMSRSSISRSERAKGVRVVGFDPLERPQAAPFFVFCHLTLECERRRYSRLAIFAQLHSGTWRRLSSLGSNVLPELLTAAEEVLERVDQARRDSAAWNRRRREQEREEQEREEADAA